ncbi:MAG: EutN/CcmL family microcompartment protein [Planctomycetaceae bacterium]
MFLARITGNVTATQKVPVMTGQTLFIVDPLRIDEQTKGTLVPTGRTFIAVDTVGAGEGEVVLIVQGSSARFTEETAKLPVDCAIIGIVDNVRVAETDVFQSGD